MNAIFGQREFSLAFFDRSCFDGVVEVRLKSLFIDILNRFTQMSQGFEDLETLRVAFETAFFQECFWTLT